MKPSYKGAWWLLATTFLLLLILSAVDGSVSLFGYSPKSSGMYDRLFASAEADSGQAPVKVEPAELDSTDTATVTEPDTLPKTILFIGDSMLEGLSPRLAAYCKASGHTLYSVIWYSSTSERWGSTGRLASYIRRINPDYIFISLGANELFVGNIMEKRRKYVKKIIEDCGDIPYIWIGPPNWKDDTGINRLIKDNTAPGCFFLSDGMKFDRKSDGAHPTAASAREWMDSVMRWMPLHAAHPFRMVQPDEKSGRPERVFIHQPDE